MHKYEVISMDLSYIQDIPADEITLGLQKRDFVDLKDFSVGELQRFLEVALLLKRWQKIGRAHHYLRGKTLAMIFTKASTRTRVSFEVGMYQLGGQALFLSSQDLQLHRGETIGDTARVLSRYVDGIMIRTHAHQDVVELARYSSVPVINGLTDRLHPCQALASYLTIWEQKGRLEGINLAYVGDGNNVAHSLVLGAAKVGVSIRVATPPGYTPNVEIVKLAKEAGRETGSEIVVMEDPREAVSGADVVYTDVWASMGQEAETALRMAAFANYQVNGELMQLAQPDAILLHCLPAHRDEEVATEIIDGPQSRVFDEAENRLHVQKAIMLLSMGGG